MGISDTRIYLELDNRLFAYERGRITELGGLAEIKGEGILVSDFPGSISRLLHVNSAPKFADVMARRMIEEEGEFGQAPTVIPHWRRKRGKHDTDIFLTALPYQTYEEYLNYAAEANEPIIIYCLYGVLHEVVKKYGKRGPVAVVCQHGRVADLIIGHRKRIYFANRSMAFDETAEQVQSVWDMVLSDIKSVEAENKIRVERVLCISWIDSVSPSWERNPGFRLDLLPEEDLKIEDKFYRASLFNVVKMMPLRRSLSGSIEKWAFRSRQAILPINVLMTIVIILTVYGHLYFSGRAKELKRIHGDISQKLSSIQQLQYTATPVSSYENLLSFIARLDRASRLPSYKAVVNDLSDAFEQTATVEFLDANYGEETLVTEIRGKINAPFAEAYKAYQRALLILEKKGYVIDKRSFSTSIKQSRFLLKLSKRVR